MIFLQKMRKVFFLSVFLIFLSSFQNPLVAEALTNQYTDIETEGFIMMPSSSDYDDEEAQAMIERIKRFPETYLRYLKNKGVTIRLINNPLTDEPEMRHLKGVVPRGWENTGLSWDDIPGSGGNPVFARIGYSYRGHGSKNLEMHEVAHQLEYLFFDEGLAKNDAVFVVLWQEEVNQLFPENAYFINHIEEFFAEALVLYYYNQETRNKVKTYAPQTALYFETFEAQMFTEDLLTLVNGASTWAIDELIKAYKYGIVPESLLSDYKNSITREEFAKLSLSLYKAISGEEPKLPLVNPFKDTDNPKILKAYDLGIIYGTSKDTFSPHDKVSREAIAVMLKRTMEASGMAIYSIDRWVSFEDEDEISDWAMDAIQAMNNLGVLTGHGNKRIDPKGHATREQAIVLALRVMEISLDNNFSTW